MTMTLTDIATTRLSSQQLATTTFKSAKELVAFMGAMQAQDYAMAKWAIGVRLPQTTDKLVQEAIDKGEILRTHVMRPTWHFVAADDVSWMIELTAPRIRALLKSRQAELGLSETIIAKSFSVMEKTMTGDNHLTRDQLHAELGKVKIATDENRLSHLMMYAELDGIVCSGITKDNKQTYALLEERVKKKKKFTKEEGLAELVKRYFSSHGPANIADFVWWSGLSMTDARNGLELVKSNFHSQTIDSETYWFSDAFVATQKNKQQVHLLPAFDEFIISYKKRAASLPAEHHVKAVSSNGIFRPTIVINGKVTGLWKRTVKKDKVLIETNFFSAHDKATKNLIEESAQAFGHFLGKKVEVLHLK